VVHQRIGIARNPISDEVEKILSNGMVGVKERCERRLQTRL